MRGCGNKRVAQTLVGALLVIGAACSSRTPESAQAASGSGNEGLDALAKAKAMERVVERTAPKPVSGGTAPKFVIDPGWPRPLPNNWIIGDIGGLYVDRHDHIWVYHRPRALDSTDAGALGAAGKDAKGNPISVLGHGRPYGQLSGCCIPAPSVLEFDKAGTLLQAWGGPGDPGFLEKRCR